MPSPEITPGSRGYIIPIGGAEDKVRDRTILRRFIELCGNSEACIAIIPTASSLEDTGDRYVKIFKGVGAKDVRILNVVDRTDADEQRQIDKLEGVTGIFMTGGNQLRLSTVLGGTALATQIRRLNASGVHVAGTSAGAAFISEHMIAFGAEGSTPIA